MEEIEVKRYSWTYRYLTDEKLHYLVKHCRYWGVVEEHFFESEKRLDNYIKLYDIKVNR